MDDELDINLLDKMQPYIEQGTEMIKYKMKIIKKDRYNQKEEIMLEKDGEGYLVERINGPVFYQINGQDAFNKLCFEDKFLDSPCLYLIKKELLERTKLKFEKNVYHEDFGLIPSLIVNAKSVISTNYYGYKYFQTEQSVMRSKEYEKSI